MRTSTPLVSACVLAALFACNPPIPEDTGGCAVDTDGDGEDDCVDLDDDGDGMSDEEETTRGTDPLDWDSDKDGLSDNDEVNLSRQYSPDGGYTTDTTTTDPLTRTLLVEVDFMAGFRPDPEVILLAGQAFDDAGIEVFFLIDDAQPLAVTTPLTDQSEIERLLYDSADQDVYVHVLFADVADGKHGTTHYAEPNNPAQGNYGNTPDPRYAGAVVFAGQIATDATTWATEFASVDVTVDDLVARTLVKQIGHLVGCTDEGWNNGLETTNVMVNNGDLPAPTTNAAAWQDATRGGTVGHPTFTADSIGQMDLALKASVEIGTSPSVRSFDMGPAAGPVGTNTFLVTETDAYDPAVGWGWEEPLPTVALQAGSDPADDRTADYVAGDPSVKADTQFRISHLGTEPVDLFIRLGGVLDSMRGVRCEMVNPIHGTAYLNGTIPAGGGYLETPTDGVMVWPVPLENQVGNVRGDILVTCLDDDTFDDAPIEYMRMTKREP